MNVHSSNEYSLHSTLSCTLIFDTESCSKDSKGIEKTQIK